MLSNESKRATGKSSNNGTYINFSKGKVFATTPEGKETYQEISGYICDIMLTTRTIGSRNSKYWYIILKDEGERYKLGFYYEDSSFKGVIMALREKGIKSTDRVTFVPYLNGDFTNIDIYLNDSGEPLRWTGKLPEIEIVKARGKAYKDSTKRMEFIKQSVADIVAGLGYSKGK